ncbi:MAG: hypothetical protein WC942_12335 [Clostridia bacterium]|jgi:hypothetical protein
MKIEIINKAMLCWDDDESLAREYHVLAKVTECNTEYPFKVICNENTYPNNPEYEGRSGWGGRAGESGFKNAKPLPLIKPRTIEDGLEEGDVIVKINTRNIRKVLGIYGKEIFLCAVNMPGTAITCCYTLEKLISLGYTLLQPEHLKEE